MNELTGQCMCGAVTFKVTGEGTGIVSCHCKECQQLHGNYNPMWVVNKEDFTVRGEDSLEWYNSSEEKSRGFCKKCGAAMFMRQETGPKMLISVGCIDDTVGMENIKNVFTQDAGTYYVMSEES
ncbi:MAG TPA: GFA family protein [Patescibacteria group bacterium]